MKQIISLILCLLIISPCWAKVDLKTTKRLIIPVDTVTPKISSTDVAKVVPLDLRQGDSEGTVFKRIADRGISLWFNSSFMKETSLGRIAEETQQKLKADVIVEPADSSGVSHKFSFKVEAFQALAKLEYTGWLKCDIAYDAKSAATDILFKEKVFADKDLVLGHKASREQNFSSIGLAWTW